MASTSLFHSPNPSPRYDILFHSPNPSPYVYQTHHPIPPRFIKCVLTIEVGYYTTHTTPVPFFSQQTVWFPLVLLQNHDLFHISLSRMLSRLRINTRCRNYGRIFQEILQLGLRVVHQYDFRCKVFHMKSVIFVERQHALMTRVLDISRSEFESNDYGMIAATPSSVEEMITRVTVEEGGEQSCVVCMEELEVGLEASRMPCSHIFHADCIETWLKKGHSCPICRYEMPTHHDQLE